MDSAGHGPTLPGPTVVASAWQGPLGAACRCRDARSLMLSCMDGADGVDELVGALVARRRWVRMSQEEVAAACGVSQATISRIEDGLTDPSLRVLLDYAEKVRLSLVWRLGPLP